MEEEDYDDGGSGVDIDEDQVGRGEEDEGGSELKQGAPQVVAR